MSLRGQKENLLSYLYALRILFFYNRKHGGHL